MKPVPKSIAKNATQEALKSAKLIAVLGPVSAQIAFVIELTLVPVVLHSIQADLGLSLQQIAMVFNAYSIAMAVGILCCALMEGRLNSFKLFGIGVAFFFVGSAFICWTNDQLTLIIGRACQGLGAGLFTPLIPVLLTQATPDRPGRALMLWGSAAGYIAAFAPMAYGTFLTGSTWRFAFFIIALVAVLSLILTAISETSLKPKSNERKTTKYGAIFGSKKLLLTFVYVFVTYGAITFYLFRIPLSLAETGMGTTGISIVLSVLWLSFSFKSTLLRNLVDDHRLKSIMVSAPFFIAFGMTFALSENLLLVVLSACLVGCGLACSNAPSTQLVLRNAPKGLSALATSIDISVARLGGIITVTALAEITLTASVMIMSVSCMFAVAFALIIVAPTQNSR